MKQVRKHGRGDGSVDPSGKDSWRVRYRLGGKRFQKVVTGTKADAQRELRRLLHSGDTGQHAQPRQADGRRLDRTLVEHRGPKQQKPEARVPIHPGGLRSLDAATRRARARRAAATAAASERD